MPVLLILISFITLFYNISCYSKTSKRSPLELLVISILFFSLVLLAITELLSAVNGLNFNGVYSLWFFFMVFSCYNLFRNRKTLRDIWESHKLIIKGKYLATTDIQKLALAIIALFLSFLFVQGILYPPNNWDSMTYHMPRVVNWMANESVNHYPTNIVRQLYQPPFAEFIILHFNLLSFGDYFSNSVQFVFLIFNLNILILILRHFKIRSNLILLGGLLLISIPEVILQGTSTKNDIVVSFYILCSIYFFFKLLNDTKIINFVFLAISIGLAILTKGTAYIFLAPLILILGILLLIRFYKTESIKIILGSGLALLIVLSINLGHYSRNYSLSQTFLGGDTAYVNEAMSIPLFSSNVIKNLALHFGSFGISEPCFEFVTFIHDKLGMELNNPKTSYYNIQFQPNILPNHEDYAQNLFHIILILISLVIIAFSFRKYSKNKIIYLAILLLQGLLFSLYLKWQPWHTRLHTPMFIASIPVIIFAVRNNKKFGKILKIMTPLIVIYGFLILLFNSSRPLISLKEYTSSIKVTDARYKKYFANRLDVFSEFDNTIDSLKNGNYKKIGLIMNDDGWEYPIVSPCFFDLNEEPIHLEVRNYSNKLSSIELEKRVDYIVSDRYKDSIITYNGINYKNMTPDNKFIWTFKKN